MDTRRLIDKKLWRWIVLILSLKTVMAASGQEDSHTRTKRTLIFPQQSIMQLATAVTTPAQIVGRNIATNFGLMFNINLPTNVSQWYPYRADYRKKRSLDETNDSFYRFLEVLLTATGMDGRACIGKSVCQLREAPLEGDQLAHKLINLIFGFGQPHTTSFSEPRGHLNTSCDSTFPTCPFTPIDALTDLFE